MPDLSHADKVLQPARDDFATAYGLCVPPCVALKGMQGTQRMVIWNASQPTLQGVVHNQAWTSQGTTVQASHDANSMLMP